MSIASYDAHRKRMREIAIMRAAQPRGDDVQVDWLAVFGGACLGLSLLVVLTLVAWFAPEIWEFTR